MKFIHAQFNQYFTPPKFRSELQIHFNFFIIFFFHLAQHNYYDFLQIKGFTSYVFFSACAKWQFFWAGDLLLDVKTNDKNLIESTKFTF